MSPGIVGRLFREFAVTLSVAIGVSLFVSLTATPMSVRAFPTHRTWWPRLRLSLAEGLFNGLVMFTTVAAGHSSPPVAVSLITIGTVILTGYMIRRSPKAFSHSRTPDAVNGYIQGDQDISFAAIPTSSASNAILMKDPAVDTVTAFTGGGNGTSTSRMFAQ